MSRAASTQTAPQAQAPPAAPALEDMLISADGLGPIRIGAPIGEAGDSLLLLQQRGSPGDPDDPLCSEWSDYRELYVLAIDGKVASVSIFDADRGIRTAEGIGIGSSAAEVLAAYPSAERWESEMYREPGHELRVWSPKEDARISFGIHEDGRVAEIGAGGLYYGCSIEE
jgi:hypothetical protein